MSRSLLKEAFVRGVDGSVGGPDAARVCRQFADCGRARAQTIVAAWILDLPRGRVL